MTQLPTGDEVYLDHLAHFVPNMAAAAATLERLGFIMTPFTAQQNRTPQGMIPSGMANRCIMLRRGYLEFLTAVSESELASQFQTALDRYVGVHLIAMSVDRPLEVHANLQANGFSPKPPVNLTRPVSNPEGGADLEARFTVMRVDPSTMPEGRIQLLQHHTPEVIWQERWMAHPNAVSSLNAILLSVDDPAETAKRFGRFTGLAPREVEPDRWILELDRASLIFATPRIAAALAPWAGNTEPAPRILGYAVDSLDPVATAGCFAAGGVKGEVLRDGEAVYPLPPTVGGFMTVCAPGGAPSWVPA